MFRAAFIGQPKSKLNPTFLNVIPGDLDPGSQGSNNPDFP